MWIGKLIDDERKTGKLNKGARGRGKKGATGSLVDPRIELPTLEKRGVDKNLAKRAREAWALQPDDQRGTPQCRKCRSIDISTGACARAITEGHWFNLLASSDAKGDFDPASPLHEA